jgi:hypothetical protein
MDTLTIIQMADTGIDAGTDLCKHKYSVTESVEAVIKYLIGNDKILDSLKS